MHWMTLFLMNNYSVAHPDYLKPGDLALRAHLAYCVTVYGLIGLCWAGTRLSVGRPYIVQAGDTLYSIAIRFGTTWQVSHNEL